MLIPNRPSSDQVASCLPAPRPKRRRRRKSRGPRGTGPSRPGRFFRTRAKYDRIRRAMKPLHLGECDWLLYRRRFNPYALRTFKGKAYEKGFIASKHANPKPRWDPIP